MRIFEVTVRGHQATGTVIQSYWYRDEAAGAPDADAVAGTLDRFQSDFQPKLIAALPAAVTVDEVACQGYAGDTWERSPYLPIVRGINLVGTFTPDEVAPFTVAIFSCKVEPVVPGPQPLAGGGTVLRPVRRGYIAFGPMPETQLQSDGTVANAWRTQALIVAYRDQIKAALFDAASDVTTRDAIRVSKPVGDNPQRGYGLIKDVVIRDYASTRRSRMRGKGI